MLTPQALHEIEAGCTRAPVAALAAWRAGVGAGLAELDGDAREHAAALLLKLERVEADERAPRAAGAAEFLAPELLLPH